VTWKPKYYLESEFRGWYYDIDIALLYLIDKFREEWGAPVLISPASGSIGRRVSDPTKPGWTSQHNIVNHGKVKAIDLMPTGMDTPADRERAYEIARQVGFTGIGIYPDWRPRAGIHVDIRADKLPGDPAKWSAFDVDGKQEYFGVIDAFT